MYDGRSASGVWLERKTAKVRQGQGRSEVREGHLSRCVTLASATAKAWTALYGYWKSSVYALLSMRPNCIT